LRMWKPISWIGPVPTIRHWGSTSFSDGNRLRLFLFRGFILRL
jgi:hypothetical protein